MIDPRFYEHKEPDPARALFLAVFAALFVLVGAFWVSATITANELHCPRWLKGVASDGHVCVPGPLQGPLWVIEYRGIKQLHVAPPPLVRKNIAQWTPRYRRAFDRALDVSAIGTIGGLLLSIAAYIAISVLAQRGRNKRVMIGGTRFWASDDEVFRSGLAVNYRPSLRTRLARKFGISK